MSRPARIAWKRKAECIASRTASLPRKAKLRFEIPPLVRAPGQRALISGSASRNAFAKPRCSSMPVATARTFGSKIRSSGAKAGLLDEQPVGPLADRDLALGRLGLALLVERHHDDARAVAAHGARLLEERLLPLLQRERVDDALPLDALEPGLEHRPARAVDHDRDPRHLGLGRDEVEEGRHRPLAVEQVGVHVHVEEVGAAAHLLERDVEPPPGSRPPRRGAGNGPSR